MSDEFDPTQYPMNDMDFLNDDFNEYFQQAVQINSNHQDASNLEYVDSYINSYTHDSNRNSELEELPQKNNLEQLDVQKMNRANNLSLPQIAMGNQINLPGSSNEKNFQQNQVSGISLGQYQQQAQFQSPQSFLGYQENQQSSQMMNQQNAQNANQSNYLQIKTEAEDQYAFENQLFKTQQFHQSLEFPVIKNEDQDFEVENFNFDDLEQQHLQQQFQQQQNNQNSPNSNRENFHRHQLPSIRITKAQESDNDDQKSSGSQKNSGPKDDKKLELSPLRKNIKKRRSSISANSGSKSPRLSQNSLQENLKDLLEKMDLNVDELPPPYYPNENNDGNNSLKIPKTWNSQSIKEIQKHLPEDYLKEFSIDNASLDSSFDSKNYLQEPPSLGHRIFRRNSDTQLYSDSVSNSSLQDFKLIQKYLNKASQPSDTTKKIGPITVQERKFKLWRYQEKKRRQKTSKTTIDPRKKFAEQRLRYKGRFLTRSQASQILGEDIEGLSDERIKELLFIREHGTGMNIQMSSAETNDSKIRENTEETTKHQCDGLDVPSASSENNHEKNISVISLKDNEEVEYQNQVNQYRSEQNDDSNNESPQVYLI